MKKYISTLLISLIIFGGCVTKRPQNMVTAPPLPPLPPVVPSMFDNTTVYNLTAAATLTNAPPLIQNGLSNIMAYQGSSVTLSTTATGYPLAYQWRFNNKAIKGATNSSYVLPNVQAYHSGTYMVIVTNVLGKVFSLGVMSVKTTNVLINCPLTGTTTLTWCPSVSTNNAIGYSIHYGAGVATNWTPTVYSDTNCPPTIISEGTNWYRAYTNSIDVGTNIVVTISNLLYGNTYYFGVKAHVNGGLESDFSNEASKTVVAPPLTNVFLHIKTLVGGQVQLSAKLCPYNIASILYTHNIIRPTWSVLASNLVPDIYGNLFYIENFTNNIRFYKLQIQ